MAIETVPPARALVSRLCGARLDYDAACGIDDLAAITAAADELDAAIAAFAGYICISSEDLVEYSNALFIYIDDERFDAEVWGEDSTAPLYELFAISDAVGREVRRMMTN